MRPTQASSHPGRIEFRLTLGLIALAIPAHLAGLLVPSLYRDPAVLMPQNLGTDFISLVVMVPLLALTAVRAQASSRARLLWLGALGYFVYAYGMYAVGVHWNRLFLVYVALFGLAGCTFGLGLLRTPAYAIAAEFSPHAPRRASSIYLSVVAILIGVVWLFDEGRATWTGIAPRSIGELDVPTNVVHVFDLAIVLPAMLLSSRLLERGRAWGYVLGSVSLVMATAIGLWVLALMAFSAAAGFPAGGEELGLFALLSGTGAAMTWRLLAAIRPDAVPGEIARFLPHPEVEERHQIDVDAPAELVFEAAEQFDLMSLWPVRAIVRMRERWMGSRGGAALDHRPFVLAAREMGWGPLATRPGREIVMGAECRPWLADVEFEPLPPEHFAEDTTPDRVKIAWSLETCPLAPDRTRLVSDTRVVANDDGARARFRRYWRWSRFGVVAIRWLVLPAIRREAERRWKARRRTPRGAGLTPMASRIAPAGPR